MTNLSVKEIRSEALSLLKTNKEIIKIFLLYSLFIALGAGLSGIVPIAGPFLSIFVSILLFGNMCAKIDEQITGEETYELNNKSYFLSIALKYFLFVLIFSILYTAIIVLSMLIALNTFDFIIPTLLMIFAGLILTIGIFLYATLSVFPKTYIAAKFNHCTKEELKEIFNSFKENGLFNKIFSIELLMFLESFLVGIVLTLICFISFLIFSEFAIIMITLVVIFIIIFIANIIIGLKTMLSRILLFSKLAEEYK